MEAKNSKIFYGWWIVGAGFFIAVYIGGFILSCGAPLDTAKPENVRAMIEFTKEYGTYI